EVFGRLAQVLAQGLADDTGCPWCPAETEIDAAGEQAVESAELFSDDERVVVGQHDPARADADDRGHVADVRENHRHRAAGNSRGGVMLGNPEAFVPGRFGGSGKAARFGERFRNAASFADGDEIEDGKGDHGAASSAAGSASWAR